MSSRTVGARVAAVGAEPDAPAALVERQPVPGAEAGQALLVGGPPVASRRNGSGSARSSTRTRSAARDRHPHEGRARARGRAERDRPRPRPARSIPRRSRRSDRLRSPQVSSGTTPSVIWIRRSPPEPLRSPSRRSSTTGRPARLMETRSGSSATSTASRPRSRRTVRASRSIVAATHPRWQRIRACRLSVGERAFTTDSLPVLRLVTDRAAPTSSWNRPICRQFSREQR